MDLVRGEAAMDLWEISPEELAGIAVVFRVPCINRDTYEEVIPPTSLAIEVLLDEFAYEYKMSLKLMESGCFRKHNLDTSKSMTLNEEYERIRIGLKNKENRSREVEEIKNLLFDKFILYSFILDVKISGSITTCFKIKNKKDKNKNEDIAELKNNMFFLAGYQTQIFDQLKSTLNAKPEIKPTTPLDYVKFWQSQDIRDPKELASRLDDVFTDNRRLSNRALGALLPANPGWPVKPRGETDRGKRLRGIKK